MQNGGLFGRAIAFLLLYLKFLNTYLRRNLSLTHWAATMSVPVVTLIGWCIRAALEFTEDANVWNNSLVALRRTRSVLIECVKKLNPSHPRRVLEHNNIPLTPTG